jgi:hypothetical protein
MRGGINTIGEVESYSWRFIQERGGELQSLVHIIWEFEVEHIVLNLEVQVIQKLSLHVCPESKHEGFEKPRGYVHSEDNIWLEVSCIAIIHLVLHEGGVVQHHLGIEPNMKARELAEVP